MKKLFLTAISFLVTAGLSSCDTEECCAFPEEGNAVITGTWLLVECGYSPGAGYITEPVSEEPAQTLTVRSTGLMTSTIHGLEEFRFYYIDNSQDVIAFYEHNPGVSPDPSTFSTSYHFSFEDGSLLLHFRYCIEGCHLKLRKVE